MSSEPLIVLSSRQLAELQQVCSELDAEPDADVTPATGDATCRAQLHTLLTGVISSEGHLAGSALRELVDLQAEAENLPRAGKHVDRAVAVVMPHRENEPGWLSVVRRLVTEHVGDRGYAAGEGELDRAGYVNWRISIPGQEEPTRLCFSGEVALLIFPGGFLSAEFGYTRADSIAALRAQLRLLDAYADPATRVVQRQRLGRQRSELRISDGSVLWKGGGRRAH